MQGMHLQIFQIQQVKETGEFNFALINTIIVTYSTYACQCKQLCITMYVNVHGPKTNRGSLVYTYLISITCTCKTT